MKDALSALIASRKFLMTVLGLAVATLIFFLTRHSPDALSPTAFTGFAGGLIAILIASIAHEDAASKAAPSAVSTTGTVNVGGGGGGAPLAAMRKSMPSGGEYSKTTTRGASLFLLSCVGFGGALLSLALLACTPAGRADARTVLDVEQEACVIANDVLDVPALRTACRISDALDPELQKLLSASRKATAMKREAAERTKVRQ